MAAKHGMVHGYAALSPYMLKPRQLFWSTWRVETRTRLGKAPDLQRYSLRYSSANDFNEVNRFACQLMRVAESTLCRARAYGASRLMSIGYRRFSGALVANRSARSRSYGHRWAWPSMTTLVTPSIGERGAVRCISWPQANNSANLPAQKQLACRPFSGRLGERRAAIFVSPWPLN